jgi:hypothetical protein
MILVFGLYVIVCFVAAVIGLRSEKKPDDMQKYMSLVFDTCDECDGLGYVDRDVEEYASLEGTTFGKKAKERWELARALPKDIITIDTPKNGKRYEGDFYCINCHCRREGEGWISVSDSGRRIARGNCLTCGNKVSRILGKE